MVKPKYGVISVGKNSYGHSTTEVLNRVTLLKSRGGQVTLLKEETEKQRKEIEELIDELWKE